MGKARHILLAGGGIGGLTAALSLLQHGHTVTVLEQANQLNEVGAGIQIAANASRVLINLGLGPALEKLVSIPEAKEIRLFDTGQSWKLFDLGQESIARYGAPYWLAHRADLHAALVDAVRMRAPEALLTSARVTSFEQRHDAVAVKLADGREFTGDVLIGCDGIHSVVRHSLFGDMTVNFVGRAAWRGVVPAERLSPGLRRPIATNWIGPDANIAVYPLRGGELVNIVGAMNNVSWTAESWTEQGTRAEMQNDFRGWHPEVQELIENIDIPLKWAFRGREPLKNWTVGKVTLLGDAAHPTLPTLAQGACMSIEDAAVLARCIDIDAHIDDALLRYERTRLPRTTAIVNASTENARRLQDSQLASDQATKFVDKEYNSCEVEKRYEWLFKYDALNVSL